MVRWKDKETGEVLESFAIVTVDPNEWMAKYHDRMGVILKPKDYTKGLYLSSMSDSAMMHQPKPFLVHRPLLGEIKNQRSTP